MIKRSLLLRLMIIMLIIGLMAPIFFHRVENEKKNKDVLFALNYNNASMLLSPKELDYSLKENKKNGVNTVLIGEESINSLISSGYITGIKYNVLCHKYDDESEEIIKELRKNDNIHNDSYVLITKRKDCKEYLDKWIKSKYTNDEFLKIHTSLNADVYVLYEGISDAWHVATGIDENKVSRAYEKGFNIVLSMMVGAYSDTEYIKHVEKIIDKYDVRFLNLKESYKNQEDNKNAKKNYKALCNLIKEKELYLILTENQTQLSNQKPIGYAELIKSAEGRVLRGYETIDIDSLNKAKTISIKRYYQILNSVVDRNIRFVTINQLTNGTDTIAEKSEKTNIATKAAIEKLREEGFNTESYNMHYDYSVNRTYLSALAMLIMVVMALMMLEWLFGKRKKWLNVIFFAGGVLSLVFTFIAPEAIVLLYPTLFAVLAPCFALTAVMVYVKNMRTRLSDIMFLISSVLLTFIILALCGFVQTVLLSGLDYYLNSIIFRGIKLSLIVPILYSAISYAIIFSEKSDEHFMKKVIKTLTMDIKVYWVIIAGAIGAVGAIYLIRSGNVTSISPIENFMRNTITEIMPARPRTKEFLIGWPSLILFLYYIKNTKCTLLQWCFNVGSSILFASAINSFCHVFTSAGVIYMRLLNGLMIGVVIGAVFYVINLVLVRIANYYVKTGKEKWEII